MKLYHLLKQIGYQQKIELVDRCCNTRIVKGIRHELSIPKYYRNLRVLSITVSKEPCIIIELDIVVDLTGWLTKF